MISVIAASRLCRSAFASTTSSGAPAICVARPMSSTMTGRTRLPSRVLPAPKKCWEASVRLSCCASSCARTSKLSGASSSLTSANGSTSGGASSVIWWHRLCPRSIAASWRTTSAVFVSSMISMSANLSYSLATAPPLTASLNTIDAIEALGAGLRTPPRQRRPAAPCKRPTATSSRALLARGSFLMRAIDRGGSLATRKHLELVPGE